MEYVENAVMTASIQSEALDFRNILSFNLKTSISSPCPIATLVFRDNDGKYIGTLHNIGIGGTVSITIKPFSGSGERFEALKVLTLYVISVSIQMEDCVKMTGVVQLLLGPKWLLQRDNTLKVYKDKTSSDIVKDIVQKQDFETASDWTNSTEEEKKPRYKMTDDYTFANFLVSRAMADNKPLYFWIDLKNKAHLTTYDKMFKADTKIITVDPAVAIANYENSHVQFDGKSVSAFNLAWPATLTNISLLSPNVDGAISDFRTLSVRSYFELQTAIGDAMTGIISPVSDIEAPSGYYMPIENSLMASVEDTDLAFYANGDAYDMKALGANTAKRFLRLASVKLTGPFINILPGETLTIGQLQNIHNMENVYSSWLNAKWLVSDVMITFKDGYVYEQATVTNPFIPVAKGSNDVAKKFKLDSSLKSEFYKPS